jgi:hypothetical protein
MSWRIHRGCGTIFADNGIFITGVTGFSLLLHESFLWG